MATLMCYVAFYVVLYTVFCVAPAPARGRGNVLGEVNGVELEIAVIEVQMTPALTGGSEVIIMADIADIEPKIGKKQNSLLYA